MHTIGKVFLILNVGLVIGAVLLSARLVNTRNYWMQQVEQREEQIRQNDEQIAQKEKELGDLQAKLVAQRMAWDTMIAAPNCRPNADGSVIVGVGQNVGLGMVPGGDPAPIIHVFAPDGPQGTGSIYLGPFQIADIGVAQAQLAPLFRVQPNEPQQWVSGNWRLWQVIPSNAPSRVVSLTSEIVEKLEAVSSREATLALQEKAVQQAQAHLDGRRRELLGNPDAPKIEAAPEITDGLVAALREAEATRNEGLAELDRLRRAVDESYERLTSLVTENARNVTPPAAAAGGPGLSVPR